MAEDPFPGCSFNGQIDLLDEARSSDLTGVLLIIRGHALFSGPLAPWRFKRARRFVSFSTATAGESCKVRFQGQVREFPTEKGRRYVLTGPAGQ